MSSSDEQADADGCPVCLEEYGSTVRARRAPCIGSCGHGLCKDCVLKIHAAEVASQSRSQQRNLPANNPCVCPLCKIRSFPTNPPVLNRGMMNLLQKVKKQETALRRQKEKNEEVLREILMSETTAGMASSVPGAPPLPATTATTGNNSSADGVLLSAIHELSQQIRGMESKQDRINLEMTARLTKLELDNERLLARLSEVQTDNRALQAQTETNLDTHICATITQSIASKTATLEGKLTANMKQALSQHYKDVVDKRLHSVETKLTELSTTTLSTYEYAKSSYQLAQEGGSPDVLVVDPEAAAGQNGKNGVHQERSSPLRRGSASRSRPSSSPSAIAAANVQEIRFNQARAANGLAIYSEGRRVMKISEEWSPLWAFASQGFTCFPGGRRLWNFSILNRGSNSEIMFGVSNIMDEIPCHLPGERNDLGCCLSLADGQVYYRNDDKPLLPNSQPLLQDAKNIGVLLDMNPRIDGNTLSFYADGQLVGVGAGPQVLTAARYFPVVVMFEKGCSVEVAAETSTQRA